MTTEQGTQAGKELISYSLYELRKNPSIVEEIVKTAEKVGNSRGHGDCPWITTADCL